MRYVVATYNSLHGPLRQIPFGIVLNNGSKTFFYFSSSENIKNMIKLVNPQYDKATFEHFEQTFNELFIKTGKAVITDDEGNKKEIGANEDEFLQYLAQTYEGPYQYLGPANVEGQNPEQVLNFLQRQLLPA